MTRGSGTGWRRILGDLDRPPEHSLALRGATLGAVLAAVTAVLGNDVGGAWLWVFAVVGTVAGSVASHLLRHHPRPWIPVAVTIVATALTVRFVLRYGGTSPGELRVPLAELLVTLEALRSFSLRTRRDLRFALASSLAMISVAGALSLSIGFGAHLAAWAAFAVAALALGYRSELAELGAAAAVPVPAPSRRGALRPVLVSLTVVAALGAVAFLAVPAARSSRFLAFTARLPSQVPVPSPGGLSNPALGGENPSRGGDASSADPRASFGYFGFSNRLDTSVRGRPDDTLVMRVRASSPDFWRGQSFDVWDGRTWTLSDERTTVVRGGGAIPLLDPPGEPPAGGEELIQTFYLETSGPNVIFAANRPTHVYIPQRALFQLTDGSVRTGVELEAGAAYTVVSRRPEVTAGRLRATGNASETATPAGIRERYTQLPQVPSRVRRLARDLTAGERTTYDKVRAIEEWMGANTRYSLDIPALPPGQDAVERFLFEDRVGFCEQIGSSLVVMLRSQGIPARLVVGYTPGERNPFTGLYEVRARDAHAWAEVYFPGIGWQGFDPTAQVPLSGESPPDAARVGLQGYLDRHLPDLSPPLVAGLLVAIAGAAVAWRWRRLREAWRGRRGRRTWSEEQLARLERIGRAGGRERGEGETVREYAAALGRTVLRDRRLDEIGEALTADAFAPDPLPASDRARVEALIGALDPD